MRRFVKQIRYWRAVFYQFRFPLLAFVVLTLVSGSAIALLYRNPETGRAVSLDQGIYAAFTQIFLESTLPFPQHPLLQAIFFLQPILGTVFIVQALVQFGIVLFNKSHKLEDWYVIEASTLSGHIIICGLGRVGFRVVQELEHLGESMVVIEREADSGFVTEMREKGVPVFLGDARSNALLGKANIAEARAVIAATDNDLANIEIATNAREMNPKIRVVLRLFNDKLAKQAETLLGFECAISPSTVSAPAFVAGAIGKSIYHSFYIDKQAIHVADLSVVPDSRLKGRTIAALEKEIDMTVVLHKGPNGMDLHPKPDTKLESGDRIVILALLEKVRAVERLNRS